MSQRIDLLDKKFGRLNVIDFVGISKFKHSKWGCLCDCGKYVIVLSSNLRRGLTKSCGCLNRDVARERGRKYGPLTLKHGHASKVNGLTSTYHSWRNMLSRCENPNISTFKYYGEKGIKIDPRWHFFECFLIDMGEKPEPGWHIHRLDSEKGYFKENCEWFSPEAHLALNGKNRGIKKGVYRK